MKIGTIVFIYAVYGDLMGPLFGFVHGMRNYYRAMADFESLFQYGKIRNDIKERLGAKKLKIKKGEVEFRDVNFGYNKKQKLLNNFSLKINKNEKVAFVGHSGSGKSTLVKLLYRLYDVNKGAIFIDNENIKNVKQESLRSELSIVPQECILFDDTIYNNVAFSNPTASKKEVIAAMKFAQLYRVVETFPQKEKTIVGERGIKLSGGEKQRVSIARAILANKKILILDEATSALDSETEFEIQRDLEKLMIGRTSLIIAHRLSTIMKADKIIVLDKGKIVQIGNHEELIKKPGKYRKLWRLQKGGYIK
jgi:ATP-binding cassette subfamily B protein